MSKSKKVIRHELEVELTIRAASLVPNLSPSSFH